MVNLQFTYEELVAALGSIWALYKSICWLADRYDWGQKRKEAKLLKQADMFMMCEIIRVCYRECISDGYVEETDLEHIEKTYGLYKALGGNGTAERWMDELRKLPRKGQN